MSGQRQLNRNEMDIVPSPAVVRAVRNFRFDQAGSYFDGYYGSRLRPVLARKYKLPEAQISTGYGTEFFLRTIFDACIPGRDTVLAEAPHYSFYSAYTKAKNIHLETSALIDRGDRFEFDIPGFLKKIKAHCPRVVLITSPNNPTGNSITLKGFEKIIRGTPASTLVVLDEAYHGFDLKYDGNGFIALVKKYPNVVILRSFSKQYGLAGLRIGFALWGSRAKALIRYEDLYLGGSRLLEEMALAALRSSAYYRKLAKQVIADRENCITKINRLRNFKAYASNGNFAAIKVDKMIAPNVKKTLDRLPVAIAKFVAPEMMRVSLGSHRHIAPFIKTLQKLDDKNSAKV